jgi:2,3-bisphosphoglycerate-dependent phosphoglycerate mutase
MDGTRVVLVRHGHSVAQEEGFLSGHDTCKGLSELGRRQVLALRDRLARTGELAGAAALYASILPRAIETAQLLAPAVGSHEVRTDCGFCEGHVGEAEGRPYADLEGLWGSDEWSEDHRPFPGWETWAEMGQRVARALDEVVARHAGETVVVACHGGVIACAMQRWLALDERSRASGAWYAPANSSLTEWRFARNPFRASAPALELVRFNDHAHLAGTDLG